MGRKTSKTPSKKQLEILKFIEKYIKENSYPPAIRDICAAVNLSSSSTVFLHLNKLQQLGFIERDNSKTRSIRLVKTASGKPVTPTPDVEKEEYTAQGVVNVPVIGKIAAGKPILAAESIERIFPVPDDFISSDGFMLKVKGLSMVGAGILDGDYILVRRQSTAENGEIVAALLDNNEATVKTFYKENGHIRLQPENMYFDPIIVEDCIILGKVVGVFRKL